MIHEDTELQNFLLSGSHPLPMRVHVTCRKLFSNERRGQQILNRRNSADEENDINFQCKRLRSSVETFHWKQHCFFL